MWGLTEIAAGALKLWNLFFGAKNAPDVKKAEQINAEKLKLENFNKDIALAAKGDQEALKRVQSGISHYS